MEWQEGYGPPFKDGKGVRARKYEAVDGKLKCRYCDACKFIKITFNLFKFLGKFVIIYFLVVFLSLNDAFKHEREKHPKNPGSFICTTY